MAMRRYVRSAVLMVLGALLLAAPSLAGASYSATPTSAFTGCGVNRDSQRFYFSACNVLGNETSGWVRHAENPTRIGGLSFQAISPFTNLSRNAAGAWLSGAGGTPHVTGSPTPIPVSAWGGASCTGPRGALTRGCDATARFALNTSGEQRSLERAIMARPEVPSTAAVVTRLASTWDTPHYRSTCDASSLVYVVCVPHTRFRGGGSHYATPYTLETRTVTIRITNYYPQRLIRTAFPAWGSLIKDVRSVTPETTLPSGQSNSATSIAPFAASNPATIEYGALRPIAAASEATLVYQFTGTPVRPSMTTAAPTNLAGGQLTLRVALNAQGRNNVERLADGTVIDPGSSCSFNRPFGVGFDAIRCDAPSITVQGNNTLVTFNVEGT